MLGAVQLERDRDVVPAESETRTLAAAREDVGHRAAAELSHRVGAGERLDVAHLARRDQPGASSSMPSEELPLVELLGVVAHEERRVVGDRVEPRVAAGDGGLLGHSHSSLLPGVVPRMDRCPHGSGSVILTP